MAALKCKVTTHCLMDELVERFFGHVPDRSSGDNPRLMKFAKIVANDWIFLLFVVCDIFWWDVERVST